MEPWGFSGKMNSGLVGYCQSIEAIELRSKEVRAVNDMNVAPASQTFYYHWWAFWKPLAAASVLTAAGAALLLILPPLGFILLILAAGDMVGVCMFRAWNTFQFINGNRLIRKRGFLGSAEDFITLFGVISPYQVPILGRWFNVGSVHLGIPGPDVHINHIANFSEFHRLLLNGAERQEQAEPQLFQFIIQFPPPPYYWPDRARELPAERPRRAHDYDDEIHG